MDVLKLLKGMDERGRARAFESVINSEARLFIFVTTPHWFLLPFENYADHCRPGKKVEVKYNEVLQDATLGDGRFEFLNGKEIATELVGMRRLGSAPLFIDFRIAPVFLDEKRKPAFLATFKAKNECSNDLVGFLSMVIMDITLDHLAIAPIRKQTRTDLMKVLMLEYLESAEGIPSFEKFKAHLLKQDSIDETHDGKYVSVPKKNGGYKETLWATVNKRFVAFLNEKY